MTAVLGGLGTFAAFVVAMVLDPVILATGGGWMIAGMLLYVAYRRYQGLPLRETVKVETLTPLGVEEVEYQSILVAFDDDDPFAEETVATAKALAARRRRAIHVLSLVTVPRTCRSTPSCAEREGAAQTKIEQAKLICGQRVSGHVEHVRLGQAGPGDRRRGEGDRGGGDRDAAALPRRRAALRQDAADGAREAALPGDRLRAPGESADGSAVRPAAEPVSRRACWALGLDLESGPMAARRPTRSTAG